MVLILECQLAKRDSLKESLANHHNVPHTIFEKSEGKFDFFICVNAKSVLRMKLTCQKLRTSAITKNKVLINKK